MPGLRGAVPTPRHKLLAATPFRAPKVAIPATFCVVPKQLSYWDNDNDGDCVTAEEAYAKACYSVMSGLDELFVPDSEVIRWAKHYGFLNGATLTDVMDVMQKDGFSVAGHNWKDGAYQGIDYSNPDLLRAAISQGPVKLGLDANAIPASVGGQNGWHAIGSHGNFSNEDHCTGLSGYGTAGECYAALGMPVPTGIDPNTLNCFLFFTWKSIGVVDHLWLMSTVAEAWVRVPTTPGQGPTPVPPPPPGPPVPPVPPVPPPPPAPTQYVTIPPQVVHIPGGFGPKNVTIPGGIYPVGTSKGAGDLNWGPIWKLLEELAALFGNRP